MLRLWYKEGYFSIWLFTLESLRVLIIPYAVVTFERGPNKNSLLENVIFKINSLFWSQYNSKDIYRASLVEQRTVFWIQVATTAAFNDIITINNSLSTMLVNLGIWRSRGYHANNILLLTFFIFTHRFLYKSSQCLAACPIGTYQGDSIIKECLDCPDNCLRCTNSGQKCEICSMDHFLVADLRQCVKTCGEGKFSYIFNFFS